MSEMEQQGREIDARIVDVNKCSNPPVKWRKAPLDRIRPIDIECIEHSYGIFGTVAYNILTSYILRDNGYYGEWGINLKLAVINSIYAGLTSVRGSGFFAIPQVESDQVFNYFDDMFSSMLDVGLFNRELLLDYQILTGKLIQREYFDLMAGRRSVFVIDEYLLIDQSEFRNLAIVSLSGQKKSGLSPIIPAVRGGITPKLRHEVMRRDNFRCVLCGRNAQEAHHLEIDHIYPVSAGGGNEIENLRTLCWECNSGKGSTIEDGASE